MKKAIGMLDRSRRIHVSRCAFLSKSRTFLFCGLSVFWIFVIGALESRSEEVGLELEGFIKPFWEVNVGCEVTGVLESLLVEKSDIVQKGQIIAKLDVSVEQQSVELARANLKLIEATIQLHKESMDFSFREFQRKNELYKKDSLSFFEKDQSETNWRISSLSLQEAIEKKRVSELDLKQTSAYLQRRIIRSSIDGVVVERFLTPGELVNEQPILKLAQLHPLRVEVIAPLSAWGKFAVGMKAEIRPVAPLNDVYFGQVKIIDRVIDAGSATFGVEIELPNQDYSIPAGVKCLVRFLPESPAPTP